MGKLPQQETEVKSKRPTFIAEIKTQSPYGFKSSRSFIELAEMAIQFGDCISVLDEALWGGDFNTISFVRKLTSKPILAKGLHSKNVDIQRAFDHGASYVLVYGRMPHINVYARGRCFVEWPDYDAYQSHRGSMPSFGYPAMTVCNARDMRTGRLKDSDAYSRELSALMSYNQPVCQASNIRTPEDIVPGVDAYIVGTYLPEFIATATANKYL